MMPLLGRVTSGGPGGTLVEDRVEQRLRVRVVGLGQDGAGGARLDELARLHDRHAVAQVGDDAEVVRDEEHRHVALGLQVAEQVEHFGLHRHVEGRGRLVGDDQVGVGRDGAGDQHALRHAARDLERVRVERALRVRDADPVEQRERLLGRILLAHPEPDAQRLDELAADRERLVEVRHRLLRDVPDAAPADARIGALVGVVEQRALVVDRAAGDVSASGEQSQHRERRLRLARARFADQAVDLALADLQRDAVDDLERLAVADPQIGDGQHGLLAASRGALVVVVQDRAVAAVDHRAPRRGLRSRRCR